MPLFLVTWFSRWHVVLDFNAPTCLGRPNNRGAERATVRMTPCLLGDCTVLDTKLLAARTSMVDFPCPDITVQELIAKWTLVHETFLCNNTVLHRKLVPTDASMVDSSCPDNAVFRSSLQNGHSYTKLFSVTTPSCTENWCPQTPRWSIFPVLTLLITSLFQNGHLYGTLFSATTPSFTRNLFPHVRR